MHALLTDGLGCAFVGRLGKDPELRTAASGKPWLSFSAVVSSKSEDGQWVQVSVFGDLASSLHGHPNKIGNISAPP